MIGIDEQLDQIMETIDDLIVAGRLSEIDQILRSLEVDLLDPAVLLGYLVISRSVKDRLSEWEPFRIRAQRSCVARGMPPGKAERLFGWTGR